NVGTSPTTLATAAGSRLAAPGCACPLNKALPDFDAVPASPTLPDPNLPAAGKRPRSSMAPTIVLHANHPFLALGSPGGSMIITTVLQTLLDRLDFGMSLPDAVAAPRASQRNSTPTNAEPGFVNQYGAELMSS